MADPVVAYLKVTPATARKLGEMVDLWERSHTIDGEIVALDPETTTERDYLTWIGARMLTLLMEDPNATR